MDGETVLALDLGDVSEPHTKRMDHLADVRDGSTGKYRPGQMAVRRGGRAPMRRQVDAPLRRARSDAAVEPLAERRLGRHMADFERLAEEVVVAEQFGVAEVFGVALAEERGHGIPDVARLLVAEEGLESDHLQGIRDQGDADDADDLFVAALQRSSCRFTFWFGVMGTNYSPHPAPSQRVVSTGRGAADCFHGFMTPDLAPGG